MVWIVSWGEWDGLGLGLGKTIADLLSGKEEEEFKNATRLLASF